MGNGFFNAVDGNFGIKGLGEGNHLSHGMGSGDFHITTPIKINGIGTMKMRDFFDISGNFMHSDMGFTDME